MKKDKLKIYALECILLTILSFTLFVSNIYNRTILAIIFAGCSIATWFFIKKRKTESINANKVTTLLVIFAIIYLIAFYLMGLYFGYYKATITFSFWALTHHIIPIAIIIISSEMMRNVLLAQNTKSTKVITFIVMVLIDLIIYIDIYNINTFDKIVEVVGFTFFASVASNLLYNYISNRYGFMGNIIYRLIIVLYVYIIPYIPNVYVFFRAILRMVYPYIIYQVLEYTFAKNDKIVAIDSKRNSIMGKVILAIIITVIAMLISCQFKYGILVIGSGSMTGAINKGDAIVFEQYDNQEKIEEGQVIIFNKDNLQIVHRIVDVKKVNGELRYTTKGDANQQNDDGYITNNEINGICKFRIPYIGYQYIWLRDIFLN